MADIPCGTSTRSVLGGWSNILNAIRLLPSNPGMDALVIGRNGGRSRNALETFDSGLGIYAWRRWQLADWSFRPRLHSPNRPRLQWAASEPGPQCHSPGSPRR